MSALLKDKELLEFRSKLLGSLLFFTQTFFKLRTGRDFDLSFPIERESHYITVARELTSVFRLETNRLLINIPPGHAKSTMLSYFIAWAFAHYPDCQFLYISYSHDLAAKHTANIREIMQIPAYRRLFNVEIDKNSSAKDDFKTTAGGALKAFGSSGGITGQDAGLPNQKRFTGAVLMDDMHKPLEVHSDTIRQGVIENYEQTIKPRPRAPNVPIIGIGQMLHEDDLFAYLKGGLDGCDWKKVVLKAVDEKGHVLCPSLTPLDMLQREEKFNPYVYYAQYQQDPQPPGGSVFKKDNFFLMDTEPSFITTFITADTAETDKDYNDPTVFSFWGIYKINDFNRVELNQLALHWIHCVEIWIEPKYLKDEFLDFYAQCYKNNIPPEFAAIEKKSTGTTLLSVLEDVRGLQTRSIERTKASGSKTARFLEAQPYVNQKLISLPRHGAHTEMCLEHCKKITANNTHKHDDIADTLYDAIKIAFIDKNFSVTHSAEKILKPFIERSQQINYLRTQAWQK